MARRIDLGRVVGPQGPQGPQGPRGPQGPESADAGMPTNPAIDTTVTDTGLVEFGPMVTSAPFSCWVTVGRKALVDTSLQVIVTRGPNGDNNNNRVFQAMITVLSGKSGYITVPVPKGSAVFVVGRDLTTAGMTIAQRYCKCASED